MEDIYDVLAVLLEHAARTGLGEAIITGARDIIAAADPKIEAKRTAAAEQAKSEADEYAEFLAFKAAKASHGSRETAPEPEAAPPVVAAPGAGFRQAAS